MHASFICISLGLINHVTIYAVVVFPRKQYKNAVTVRSEKNFLRTGPYFIFLVDIEIQFAPEKQIYKYITFIVKKSNDSKWWD